MQKKTFHARLLACMEHGQLTVSDLSRWFERPYSTVRKWVDDKREPWGPNGHQADVALSRLEKRIRHRPMPAHLSPAARIEWMQALKRNADNSRIPKTRSA